ncbi:phosphotransferase [Flavobacterium sp. NST-5]|uniref:Phosphotransferase n=1 Tax=Flavobacterium ichthyis TaxID=2698827 RepID=A0ABW9Z9N2_9FLAO|nr:aminoglycoside phosphotransferase family protein [Flavobacterium ichthyis]NBL65601.1 phosphotransferase [Flavobacterium ichthyis]
MADLINYEEYKLIATYIDCKPIMNELITNILNSEYHIKTNLISEQRGGWASLSYRIEDVASKKFFLKIYDLQRKSTASLTKELDHYLPIVEWLESQFVLRDKIVRLIRTFNKEVKATDKKNIYILFEYIEGKTVGEQKLSEKQVFQLSEIISALHNSNDVPFDLEPITETFELEFIPLLTAWTSEDFDELKHEIHDVLKPYLSILKQKIIQWKNLSIELKNMSLKFTLCHTDIHHWNLIWNNEQLYLLDWEGLKFAPPEADIFSIYQQPYFELFLTKYCEHNPDFRVNETVLKFYQLSRRLQDISEFIQQLQFDEITENDKNISFKYLRRELNNISGDL